MKILMFNQDWFAAEWREAGHQVRTVGFAEHLDVQVKTPFLHIDTILQNYLEGFSPDLIIFQDNSAPLTVSGIDETTIPTVFYSVDTHHHVNYHKYVAGMFDKTFIAQRDYAPEFQALDEPIEWLPLWASRLYDASDEKKYDAVFVGNLDQKLNPGRVRFFEALKQIVPVHTTVGQYWTIFPHSEIVVNQTVKGDLNFRVFEAMMSGALLLTESSANGLFDLFTDKSHLVTYTKDNESEAAAVIQYYLQNRAEARRIGQAGRSEILARHLSIHRAEQVLASIQGLQKRNRRRKHFGNFANFAVLSKKMERVDPTFVNRALVCAMRALEAALREGESITQEIACLAVMTTFSYDAKLRTGAGQLLLENLAEAYVQEPVLQFACIRSRLNSGAIADAEILARSRFGENTKDTFENAESVVRSILSELA